MNINVQCNNVKGNREKKMQTKDNTLFEGLFRLPDHVWSVGGMTLLGPGSFWGVASRTQR